MVLSMDLHTNSVSYKGQVVKGQFSEDAEAARITPCESAYGLQPGFRIFYLSKGHRIPWRRITDRRFRSPR